MDPVAYMTKEGHIYKKHQTRPIEADIPLYEHPPIAFAELEEGQSIPLYEHPMPNETLDTRSYLIGRYDGLRELTDEEIDNFTARIYNCRTGAEAHEIVFAILKKARGQ